MTGAVAIRLWDWPVRLTHWGMAGLVAGLWWTAEQGDFSTHRTLGLVLLGLLLFRLAWGVVGSEPARFASFVRGPRAVLAYLRGRGTHAPGHNPLGGWSVVAMLALLATQLALGLVAQDDDGLVAGPLNHLVDYGVAESATEWHELMFDAILAFIALHVAAVLFHQVVKRANLVGAMLTGRAAAPAGTAEPRRAGPLAFAGALAFALALAGWIAAGAPPLGG